MQPVRPLVLLLMVVMPLALTARGRRRAAAPELPPAPAENWGILVLDEAQLVHLAVEGDDVVIKVRGGHGSWQGHPADGSVEEAAVGGTPALTLRASFGDRRDLARGLQRLERWWRAGSQLSLELVVTGCTLPQVPRRVVLGDGARSVSLRAPVLQRA